VRKIHAASSARCRNRGSLDAALLALDRERWPASALFGSARSRFSAADPKKPEATELQRRRNSLSPPLPHADTRKSAEGAQVCAFA